MASPNLPKLNLGFIGLGQAVGRIFMHYSDFGGIPFRITAAAEPRDHARTRFAAELGAETYRSAEELCASPNVDVVYIATPPELHRAHVELAAGHGKHIIVEKPMALTLDDCAAMIAACERNGVKMVAGHTHSFDAPILKMHEVVGSGELGKLVMINTWNFNEFNERPWPTAELIATCGPLLNQGPHQVDVVRQIGGGMVKSVRATMIHDALRGCEGGYVCHLEFEDGVPASLVYDARGFFDIAELFWWGGEGGVPRLPETAQRLRANMRALKSKGSAEAERILEQQKEQGRFGALHIDPEMKKLRGYHSDKEVEHQPFFGLTVVSCEHGAIRQSLHGLRLYDNDGVREVPVERKSGGRAAELQSLYDGVVHDKPIFHDGRWGMATLEVCLGMLDSAKQGAQVEMTRQVRMPG